MTWEKYLYIKLDVSGDYPEDENEDILRVSIILTDRGGYEEYRESISIHTNQYSKDGQFGLDLDSKLVADSYKSCRTYKEVDNYLVSLFKDLVGEGTCCIVSKELNLVDRFLQQKLPRFGILTSNYSGIDITSIRNFYKKLSKKYPTEVPVSGDPLDMLAAQVIDMQKHLRSIIK